MYTHTVHAGAENGLPNTDHYLYIANCVCVCAYPALRTRMASAQAATLGAVA